MKKKRMGVFLGMIVIMLLCISKYTYADSNSYNTSTIQYITAYTNSLAYDKTITANTRPSVGNGGAVIQITKPDGTVVASKYFPYYTSIDDLEYTHQPDTTRRIYVRPNIDDQNIQGTVTHYWF